MKFIADFHIHSKYSRATSKDMDVEHLIEWSKLKGINLIGTGDFTHHLWLEELKLKLEPKGNGLFIYKDVNFILTTEISSIYSKKGRTYRIHNVIFAPSFETVDKINNILSRRGNLSSDGRPILGMDAAELARIVFDVDENCILVPGHIWTPWFSLFGSMSGFDRIEDCFEKETNKIFALETGLSCYDDKTEVLTENGWQKFSRISYSDKICTLNLKNKEIEFQNPIKIHTYYYKGKMYRLKTKRVDLLVTPNHRLLYSPCDFRKPPKFILKEAELLFNRSKRFKKDGIWIGKNPKYFTLPGTKISHGSRYYSGFRKQKEKKLSIKSWLRFFGFWIAEGWTNKGKNGDYNVCISNQNKALLSEMKEILESFGYNVYWDKKINHTIRVRDYQLFSYLKQFGKCSDKFIPWEIKTLSKELLEVFLEYYIKGDGHIYGRTRKGLSATTTSIRLRDDLQEVALKIGMSAYYKLGTKKGTLFRSPGYNYTKTYKQREDAWVIYFIRKNLHTVLPSTNKRYNYIESWIGFKGPVFCVTVPNHVIYIRRNGIPVWCGNSDPAMNWRLSKLDRFSLISNSDSHSPSRIGREANIFDCDLDYFTIRDVLKTKDKKRFLYTVEFFPEEGKYHFDGHRTCNVCLSPKQSRENKNRCPKCGRNLTIGVMNRVEQLADRPEGTVPECAIPFKNLIPLDEIIAEAKGLGKSSQAVAREYRSLIAKFGNEFEISLNAKEQDLRANISKRIAEGILRVNQGNVNIRPGFDGEYGKISIFGQDELEKDKTQAQLDLF